MFCVIALTCFCGVRDFDLRICVPLFIWFVFYFIFFWSRIAIFKISTGTNVFKEIIESALLTSHEAILTPRVSVGGATPTGVKLNCQS